LQNILREIFTKKWR